MKSNRQRRERAIARNEKHRMKYVNQANELGLQGGAVMGFVNHKIGIPKKRK